MQQLDRDRRRTLWFAVTGALVILAIAQLDEHRRYQAAEARYTREMERRSLQASAYLDQLKAQLSSGKQEALPARR
jgi:hypothetical protein